MEVNKHLVEDTETESLGITCQKPKFPQYAVVSKRLESYKTWPEYLPLQPEALVDAGLVYTGVGDSVRCYFCGGGLRNWEREDSPWHEHAKWYPSCPHVLLVKGQNYIDRIARGENPDSDGKKQEPKPVSEEDLLRSPAALSCLQTGFSESMVKKAVAQYINTYGNSSFQGADLCQLIFQQEEEENTTEKDVTGDKYDRNVVDGADAATCSVEDIGEMKDETGNTEDDWDELYEENRRLKEDKLCKICLSDTATIIFLPCGHMVSCPQCAPALVKCPMCRMAIKGYVKAYFATF